MNALANSIALFVSGAAFGASVAHWHAGGGSAWGSLSASLLIAVIAAENLRKALRSRQSSSEAGNGAV